MFKTIAARPGSLSGIIIVFAVSLACASPTDSCGERVGASGGAKRPKEGGKIFRTIDAESNP